MSFHGESCECADCGYDSGYAEGLDDGIREGERRMLRLVFIGAACAMEIDRNIVFVIETRMRAYHHTDMEFVGWEYIRDKRVGRALANGATALAALKALAASGDEDASRVLGERGW